MNKSNFIFLLLLYFAFGCSYGQSTVDSLEEKSIFQRIKETFTANTKSDQLGDQGLTHKYSYLYNIIHSKEKLLYDSLLQSGSYGWNLIGDTLYIPQRNDSLHLASNITVFGWHPYWVGNAYQQYNYNLLNYVAWFSYDINPNTGGSSNPLVVDQWKNTDMVDTAHYYGCKVLLTITSLEQEGNEIFLDNKLTQEMLMDSVIALIQLKNADGVALNFEEIPTGYAKAYASFIKELSSQLKTENKDYVLALSIPKINAGRIYDISSLNSAVDLFVMTGYDYHSSASSTHGPIAPLRSPGAQRSIERSVAAYLDQGVDRKKMLVGLPYYGGVWDTNGVFDSNLSYRAITSKYTKLGAPKYDDLSASVYYYDVQKTPAEIIWFDDSTSLATKYDWVIQNELGGVGLWALGYDSGRPELWNLIAEKFVSDTILVAKKPLERAVLYKLAQSLRKERKVITVMGIFLVLFLVTGFVAALFDWRVREVFFSNKSYRLIFITGFFILLFLLYVIYAVEYLSNSVIILSVGLIIGAWLAYQIGRRYYKWRKNLP